MRRALAVFAVLAVSSCNCISLHGARCTAADECGGLQCVGGCCGAPCGSGAGGGSGGGAPGPVSFVSASEANAMTEVPSLVLQRPPGIAEGDVLLAILTYTRVAAIAPPPGFVEQDDIARGCSGHRSVTYAYTVPAQDLSEYRFSANLDGGTALTAEWRGAIGAWRGANGTPTVLSHNLGVGLQMGGGPYTYAIPSASVPAGKSGLGVVLAQIIPTMPIALTAPSTITERFEANGSGLYDGPAPPGQFAPGNITASDNGLCQSAIGVVVLEP